MIIRLSHLYYYTSCLHPASCLLFLSLTLCLCPPQPRCGARRRSTRGKLWEPSRGWAWATLRSLFSFTPTPPSEGRCRSTNCCSAEKNTTCLLFKPYVCHLCTHYICVYCPSINMSSSGRKHTHSSNTEAILTHVTHPTEEWFVAIIISNNKVKK